MYYVIAAAQALLSAFFLFGFFTASTTSTALLALAGFTLFAVTAVLSLVRTFPKAKPVSTNNPFQAGPFANDLYQGTGPTPTQTSIHTSIPQQPYVAPIFPEPVANPAPHAAAPAMPIPGSFTTVTLGTGAALGGVAAGYAIGAALAQQAESDPAPAPAQSVSTPDTSSSYSSDFGGSFGGSFE